MKFLWLLTCLICLALLLPPSTNCLAADADAFNTTPETSGLAFAAVEVPKALPDLTTFATVDDECLCVDCKCCNPSKDRDTLASLSARLLAIEEKLNRKVTAVASASAEEVVPKESEVSPQVASKDSEPPTLRTSSVYSAPASVPVTYKRGLFGRVRVIQGGSYSSGRCYNGSCN